ncbi:MAG: magnesium transporter CorA family protein, partial [Bacteroidota bacterium]|nr:magnesium transporter CorA family protein [Bacteroidota bacterium]
KVVQTFLEYLKEINSRRNQYELSLYNSNSNEDLLKLMRIQKSLVYFVTALKSNEMLMMKLERTNFLGLNEEEREFLQDLIVDTSQALEMANVYSNILNSTLGAFASIINNAQNAMMKKFASIFIIITLPAVLTGLYIVNNSSLSVNSSHLLYIPMALSLAVAFIIARYLMKKKWF